MSALNPSYDFQLFELPTFGQLHANEFGAGTFFSAGTPTTYVDESLNKLLALTQFDNPSPYPQHQVPVTMKTYDPFSLFDTQTPVTDAQLKAQISQAEANVQKTKDALDKAKAKYDKFKERARNLATICVNSSGKIVPADDPSAIHCWGARPGPAAASKPDTPSSTGWFADFIASLPPNAGIFMIAIVIIILLILFVSKR